MSKQKYPPCHCGCRQFYCCQTTYPMSEVCCGKCGKFLKCKKCNCMVADDTYHRSSTVCEPNCEYC